MWNVEPSANNHHINLDSQPIATTPTQTVSKPMLPGAQSTKSETPSLPKTNSRTTHHHPPSHPLSAAHPTVIHSLTESFSPPYKPFGSRESETDEEDSIIQLDSPINSPPMLSSDLASNQLLNPSNAEIMVLSASQSPPLPMKAGGSNLHRSESMFTSLNGGSLAEMQSDHVLEPYILDSDVEMHDAPSLKRPRRKGDKPNRQQSTNPFSADLHSTPSNLPRAVTFAQSPKSSRSNPRSTQPLESSSNNPLKQTSDDDDDEEDMEMTVAVSSHLFSFEPIIELESLRADECFYIFSPSRSYSLMATAERPP
jgi:hypothetical protein